MLEYYPSGITDPNYLRNSINIGPNERRVINDVNLSSRAFRRAFFHTFRCISHETISRSSSRLHFYDISWPGKDATEDLRTVDSSSFPSVVKSISARIEDKVYGRVFVGSTFRPVHKRIERRCSSPLSLISLSSSSLFLIPPCFFCSLFAWSKNVVKERDAFEPTHFTRVNRAKIYRSFCFVSP